MSNNPNKKSMPKNRQVVVHADGFLQVLAKPTASVRDRNGGVYVKYPDGSLRRCSARHDIRKEGRRFSKRTIHRELCVAVRYQHHFAPAQPAQG